jgi:hypothetical protein
MELFLMQQFTDYGKGIISDVARRYGLSEDTVITMLYAVMNGGGTMAQFNCPELGGSGQWMQGGMTMVGDMFNYNLKATVDNLCYELSGLLSNQQSLFLPPPKPQQVGRQGGPQMGGQQQSQGGPQQGGGQQQGGGYQSGFGQTSFFVSNNNGNWWPDGLGMASSTGSQNNLRYAVFPQSARLAIEANGHVTVYDTLDHQIGGVGQQQGYGASFTFTSQYGTVQVDQLPVVSVDGMAPASAQTTYMPASQPPVDNFVPAPVQQNYAAPVPANTGVGSGSGNSADSDIFATIEKLAGLRDKGILSDDEFSAKKAELLQRL